MNWFCTRPSHTSKKSWSSDFCPFNTNQNFRILFESSDEGENEGKNKLARTQQSGMTYNTICNGNDEEDPKHEIDDGKKDPNYLNVSKNVIF